MGAVFSYQPLSQSHDGQGEQPLKMQPNLYQILTSRRIRIVGLAVVLSLIIGTLLFAPTESIAKFRDESLDKWRHASESQIEESVAACTDASIDWSRFAYVQYVTNTAYLCNSVMLFEILHRLGSKADFLMMYPVDFHPENMDSTEGKLLTKAQTEYGVKLVPIEIQHRSGGDSKTAATWADSYTKLLAFNQTQYDRVLSLDSDSTVLQPMDELFLLPPCPVAIPRAYWLDPKEHTLSSQLVLISPSKSEFARIEAAIANAAPGRFDMEIVNDLYQYDSMIIPHRKYDLLTGEFRSKEHTKYLGNDYETWDPEKILAEAKFLHFSDWPVPKPWLASSPQVLEGKQPECDGSDCRARDIWLSFYSDFAKRRKHVCDISVRKAKRDFTELETRQPHPWEPIF